MLRKDLLVKLLFFNLAKLGNAQSGDFEGKWHLFTFAILEKDERSWASRKKAQENTIT